MTSYYGLHDTIWQNLDWQNPVWEEKFAPERLVLSVPAGEITENNIEQLEDFMRIYFENVPDDRLNNIINLIRSDDSISIHTLAKNLKISQKTIQGICYEIH
jgi:hypothetical protein